MSWSVYYKGKTVDAVAAVKQSFDNAKNGTKDNHEENVTVIIAAATAAEVLDYLVKAEQEFVDVAAFGSCTPSPTEEQKAAGATYKGSLSFSLKIQPLNSLD